MKIAFNNSKFTFKSVFFVYLHQANKSSFLKDVKKRLTNLRIHL